MTQLTQRLILSLALCLLLPGLSSAALMRPYESDEAFVPAGQLDNLVLAALKAKGIPPAHLCSDEVFCRRVYLDLIGTLPKPTEVRDFLANSSPTKRAALIDQLMTRSEFADYWSLKWCDLLRVKSEFPINLWPNAVQAYHHWVRDAMATNLPYDEFARQLLTSSGSNFRVPAVNFYRAVAGRKPPDLAAAAALTFMGTRLATWKQADRDNLTAFFSRVAYKKSLEWKEELVIFDPGATEPLTVTFPDGKKTTLAPDQDPRIAFADWLLAPGNPYFARALCNRAWYWFMGRGIIHEPDDIRPDNPASHPELLAYLEKEFTAAHFDLRALFRLILNSRTYQQSCFPQSASPDAERLFAYYPTRRLYAEVIIDALCYLGNDGENYFSIVPEPYTFVPPSQRTIALADGTISSHFLELFGRPARDTGLESERNNNPTDAQALYLLNSSDVQRRLERSPLLRGILANSKGDRTYQITWTYLAVLSRNPTDAEKTAAQAHFETKVQDPFQAIQDLAWALLNSKEFLYRH